MIGSLRGTLLDRTFDGEVLIEVGGVGYRVSTVAASFALVELGAPVFVFTHQHVRDDAVVLYGFLTRDERDCFEALITVNGVGPRLGLAMLSTHTPNGLRRALVDDDIDALCLVPGVGKRTAQRLLLDLKAKLAVPDLEASAPAVVADGSQPRSVGADLRAALTGLGYAPDEIRDVVSSVDPDLPLEAAVRAALRTLGARR